MSLIAIQIVSFDLFWSRNLRNGVRIEFGGGWQPAKFFMSDRQYLQLCRHNDFAIIDGDWFVWSVSYDGLDRALAHFGAELQTRDPHYQHLTNPMAVEHDDLKNGDAPAPDGCVSKADTQ